MTPDDAMRMVGEARYGALVEQQQRIHQLAGELEVAQASVARWEAAYKSIVEEADRARKEYAEEYQRLNALNVQLTRDLTEARNRIDVIQRATAFYVQWFVDSFEMFDDLALSMECRARRAVAVQMLAQSAEVPM